MIIAVLVVLIILWLLGYINLPFIPFLNLELFTLNGYAVTILNLLVFLVLASLTQLLPRPLNIIAGIILLLWVLSLLGIIAIGGLSQMLVLAVIVGLVLFVLGFV